jgi:hypothetical protein
MAFSSSHIIQSAVRWLVVIVVVVDAAVVPRSGATAQPISACADGQTGNIDYI